MRLRPVLQRLAAAIGLGYLIGTFPTADIVAKRASGGTVDLRAAGHGSNRIWRASRNEARDLAVSILLDVSRSTESAVGDRMVIDIAREALTAFAWGLQACGDDCAINAFPPLRRDRVYVSGCKGFDEPMSRDVEARIAPRQ